LDGKSGERQREPSAGALTYRLARRVVSPYQDKLSLWTERVTLLATVIEGNYHDAAQARSQLHALAPLLTAATDDLRCEAQAAGGAVANHSLVRDLLRSLQHLIDVANEHSGSTDSHLP
jgi:hypothetical protein